MCIFLFVYIHVYADLYACVRCMHICKRIRALLIEVICVCMCVRKRSSSSCFRNVPGYPRPRSGPVRWSTPTLSCWSLKEAKRRPLRVCVFSCCASASTKNESKCDRRKIYRLRNLRRRVWSTWLNGNETWLAWSNEESVVVHGYEVSSAHCCHSIEKLQQLFQELGFSDTLCGWQFIVHC